MEADFHIRFVIARRAAGCWTLRIQDNSFLTRRRGVMKILIVLTSHDQLGNTGKKTSLWLEEFAAPYYLLKDAGASVKLKRGRRGRGLDHRRPFPAGRPAEEVGRKLQQDRQLDAICPGRRQSDNRSKSCLFRPCGGSAGAIASVHMNRCNP